MFIYLGLHRYQQTVDKSVCVCSNFDEFFQKFCFEAKNIFLEKFDNCQSTFGLGKIFGHAELDKTINDRSNKVRINFHKIYFFGSI